MLKAKVKVLEGGRMPLKGSEKATCWDLYAREIEFLSNGKVIVRLGVQVEPPEGYGVKLYTRSSIGKHFWILANGVGVGDEDFRGEYYVIFNPMPWNKFGLNLEEEFPYKVGDRCIQMEFHKKPEITLEQVDELSETVRGEGGFGSTGKL